MVTKSQERGPNKKPRQHTTAGEAARRQRFQDYGENIGSPISGLSRITGNDGDFSFQPHKNKIATRFPAFPGTQRIFWTPCCSISRITENVGDFKCPTFPGSQVMKRICVAVFPQPQDIEISCFPIFPRSQVIKISRMSSFPDSLVPQMIHT